MSSRLYFFLAGPLSGVQGGPDGVATEDDGLMSFREVCANRMKTYQGRTSIRVTPATSVVASVQPLMISA